MDASVLLVSARYETNALLDSLYFQGLSDSLSPGERVESTVLVDYLYYGLTIF